MLTFPVFAELPNHPLIEQAQRQRGERVQYALENGAQVALTPDGKSFYLYGFPKETLLKILLL